MFGLLGIVFLVLMQSITINNESEYYVLKEAMEAAMFDSIDWACYRLDENEGGCDEHEVKIIEQKFVENFTRRFSASISGDASEYKIQFYDIIESPPKATVVITGKTQEYFLSGSSDSFDIMNDLTGILELNNIE